MADLSGRPFVCTGSDEPGTDKKLFGKTGKRKRKKAKGAYWYLARLSWHGVKAWYGREGSNYIPCEKTGKTA